MINESIAKLVKYGENAGLVSGLDKIYATNRILEVMQISDYEEPEQIPENPDLEETLNELLDDAAKRGLLEHNSVVYRDLFDTKLMDCLMPRPGEVVKKFEELYAKNRRRTRRRSRLQNWQNRAVIRNACSARRMWAMRDASTTRRARTTASFR